MPSEKTLIRKLLDVMSEFLEWEDVDDVPVEKLVEKPEKRDLTVGNLYYQVEAALMDEYEYPWIVNYMHNDSGSYMVFTSGGKLFRAEFELDGKDEVSITKVQQVKLAYPVIEESRKVFRTIRDSDGSLKWFAIAASTVLNRVGQIDSTALFDDFEVEFEERDAPYLTLHHLPKSVAEFGTVEGIARLGSLLIGFGTVDETTILGRVAEEQFSTGEWGISIGFMPTATPDYEEIGGVEIPVYNKGYLVEMSVLKEDRAASYFTMITNVEREINRMGVNEKAAKKLFLEFAGDDAEDEVDELLAEINTRQREIDKEGLITRDTEEAAEEEKDQEETTEEASKENEESTDEQEAVAEELEELVELDVDDEFVNQLVDMVAERTNERLNELAEVFNKFNREIRKELDEIQRFVTRANEYITNNVDIANRVATLERDDETKVKEAVEDRPATKTRKITVSHRPTEKEDGESGKSVGSLAEIAKQTLTNQGVDVEKY